MIFAWGCSHAWWDWESHVARRETSIAESSYPGATTPSPSHYPWSDWPSPWLQRNNMEFIEYMKHHDTQWHLWTYGVLGCIRSIGGGNDDQWCVFQYFPEPFLLNSHVIRICHSKELQVYPGGLMGDNIGNYRRWIVECSKHNCNEMQWDAVSCTKIKHVSSCNGTFPFVVPLLFHLSIQVASCHASLHQQQVPQAAWCPLWRQPGLSDFNTSHPERQERK